MEIIAEIGQNHNGDMQLASRLIGLAKENGADVAKFQLFDAKVLFEAENNPWYEYNLKTELSFDQAEFLYRECQRYEIEFMASVFDVERVKWLEKLNVKRYKIASRSIHDKKLIEALTYVKKPLLVSLGWWQEGEFPQVISTAPVYYLYCVSKYPTPLSDVHLQSVDFSKYAGISDHTLGTTVAKAAFARGAKFVEKHFTLDRNLFGPDHVCSMTPEELLEIHQFRQELTECMN